jgi:hypothetical protein
MKTMDPQLIRELLEGTVDVLTPEIKAEETFFKHTRCPLCGHSGCEKRLYIPKVTMNEAGEPEVDTSLYNSGPLPEGYAHCPNCNTDFNPYTGLIFKTEASMIHGPE